MLPCIQLKGFQRALLSVSVIVMNPAGEDNKQTKFLSLVHTDPKGVIPSKLVNGMLATGTQQLLDMKYYYESAYSK